MSEENTNTANEDQVSVENTGAKEKEVTAETVAVSETNSADESLAANESKPVNESTSANEAKPDEKPAAASEPPSNEETVVEKKKKNKFPIIIAIAVIAAVLGSVLYFTSDGVKRRKAMEEGDRFLSGMQYEQALAQYQAALNIDAKREERSDDVNERIKGIISTAEDFIADENYDDAIKTLVPVLALSSSDTGVKGTIQQAENLTKKANDRIEGKNLLAQADKAFEEGRYGEAVEIYGQVVEVLGDENIVKPRRGLSVSYQKLVELWLAEDYEGVAKHIDSKYFQNAIDYMETENPQFVIIDDNNKLKIEMRGDTIYVLGGNIVDLAEGTGMAVISTLNCYAIYSGEWKESVPHGKGEVVLWNKRDSIQSGTGLKSTFNDGIANGTVLYSSAVLDSIPLEVNNGSVKIVKKDEKDRFWVTESVNDHYFIISNKDILSTYICGVPGYGGAEDLLLVNEKVIDTEPPVFECSTYVGDTEFDVSRDIKAHDNVDGYVKVHCTKEVDEYREIITYNLSASDEEGNTSTMKVYEHFEEDCGAIFVSYNYSITRIEY